MLVASWGLLGRPLGGLLGRFGGLLDGLGARRLGAIFGRLGAPLGTVASPNVPLEALLAHLGALLGPTNSRATTPRGPCQAAPILNILGPGHDLILHD